MRWTEKKVGLALGGGGFRGIAHIGVLKVLEKEAIDIDLIVGTSAGALIGAAYACGLDPQEIQSKTDAYLRSSEFDATRLKSMGLAASSDEKSRSKKAQTFLMNRYYIARTFLRPSVIPSEDLHSLINYFIPDIDIRQTRIPFLAVTTDLITGKQIVFSEGPLRQAVLASCAVPGAIEPVSQGECLLADGGITSLVPVHATREAGADVVIAVTVDRGLPASRCMQTAQDISCRAREITANKLTAAELEDADVIIRPAVGDLHWTDFSRSKDLIACGEEAAHEALKKIYSSLPLKRRTTHFAGHAVARGKRVRRSFRRAVSAFVKAAKDDTTPERSSKPIK